MRLKYLVLSVANGILEAIAQEAMKISLNSMSLFFDLSERKILDDTLDCSVLKSKTSK